MILLRKYAVWLLLATMAGIAGAGLIYAIRPVVYLSTAQVDVEPRLEESLTPVGPNMGTEEQVATSGVVLDSTARALGVPPRMVAKRLTATVPATGGTATGTANILALHCAMPTPAAARRCAAAATASYLAFRNMDSKPALARLHDPLQITLVTAATLPTRPAGPGAQILLPVGALLGVITGIGAVVVRDRLDHRVRDRADLERRLDAPVLAEIPPVPHPALAFRRDPLCAAAESYRYLREHLNPLATSPDGAAVLLVTSAHAREGRTSVAANLAMAFAEAGAAVILVDADLRHPSLAEVFATGTRPGVSELLTGTASLAEVAVPAPGAPGLRLVTAGEVAGQHAQIRRIAPLTRALGEMRAQADLVVVDSAPALAVSDALTLASASDIVAVVADVQRSNREAVSAAVKQLRAAGPRIIVGVLHGAPSLKTRPACSGARRGHRSLAPSRRVPALLAGMAQAGPKGRRGQLGAVSTRLYGPIDAGTDADEGPGSAQAPA